MAKSANAKIDPEFLGEMNEKNKYWFDSYNNEAKGGHEYKKNIKEFLEFKRYTDKPLNDFTIDDVKKYLEFLESSGYKNSYFVQQVSGFKKFLIKKFPEDFGKLFLYELQDLQPPITKTNKVNGKILDLIQISYIKKYNKEKGDIYDQYIFEVFFQLGIGKDELKICQPQYKHNLKQCFSNNAGKDIPYNKKIAVLLEQIQNPEELKKKIKQVNHHYFKKVTKYLCDNHVFEDGRNLNPTDLKLTHEAYFFRCPNSHCRRLVENIVENWVLAKTESDNEDRLVCIECKGGKDGN